MYCREAEAALNELAADRRAVDQMRVELEEARARADAEANAARVAMSKAETQRRELEEMRAELVKTRGDMDEFHRTQNKSAEILEQSLREAREQQTRLEQELHRVQAQTASSRTIDTRLAQLDQMETKLRTTERELATTRRALEDERGRRDRAIALIKPKLTVDEGRS